MTRFGHLFVLAAPLLLLSASGCKSDKTKAVTGKIVLPANVKMIETDTIQLTFAPVDASANKSYPGAVSSKDLTFTAKVPPGKYKVQVVVKAYPGEKESQKRSGDLDAAVNNTFGANTPLTYEVTEDGSQKIVIDLGKKSVTKE